MVEVQHLPLSVRSKDDDMAPYPQVTVEAAVRNKGTHLEVNIQCRLTRNVNELPPSAKVITELCSGVVIDRDVRQGLTSRRVVSRRNLLRAPGLSGLYFYLGR